MTQYKMLNIKLYNSQLNKLKSAIKNGTEVTLNLSSNIVGDSNDENNFPHKLLLTNTQVSKVRKAFANGSTANIKLSKAQLHKIGQSRGFLGRLLETLDAAVYKKMFGSGFTTLIISNEEMNDIMKIVKSLEESELLKKGVIKTNKYEAKEQKGEFLRMLLGTLGAGLLGNLLTGKHTIRAGEGTIRADENF